MLRSMSLLIWKFSHKFHYRIQSKGSESTGDSELLGWEVEDTKGIFDLWFPTSLSLPEAFHHLWTPSVFRDGSSGDRVTREEKRDLRT